MTQQAMYGFDIEYGQAVVKATLYRGQSGWSLPGGRFVACPVHAMNAAKEMARLIQVGGGIPRKWSTKRREAA